MWRPFIILFIVTTTNFYTLLDSYKINDDKSTKTIQPYDQQDRFNLQEEYIEENDSSEDSYKQSNRRVVIGKWRNNGEALEPKWRDGDSVPLAPFSTISFKNGWRRATDTRDEDYHIEPESFGENEKKNRYVSSTDKNEDFSEPESDEEANKNANYNYKQIINGANSRTLISTTGDNPLDRQHESRRRIGYEKSHRTDRQFNGREFIDQNDGNLPKMIRAAGLQVPSSLAESKAINEDIEGSGKYRETLQNYPKEYELFENENDDPRPRKRRPPEHYEFPGSWNVDNDRREESYGDGEQGVIVTGQDMPTKFINQTKSQENMELKTFLKMQGDNLSLSEILQQKNLTLADLLKGKPNAINILKSNEKRFESVQDEGTSVKESAFLESPEKNSRNYTSENPRWLPRRKIMIRKSNKNTTFDREDETDVSNFSQTSLEVETTTSRIINENSMKSEENAKNISAFNSTEFTKDNETVSYRKSERINSVDDVNTKSEAREFLKPLENRESLLKEAKTVVEDGTERSSNDRRVLISNDKFLPRINNDDDEIMEFSDYPAAKMPKFVAPMIYESATLNTKRKSIPLSAIRTINPVEDPDLKLKIEYILSPDNEGSIIINETNGVGKDSRKIVEEIGARNFSIININEKDEDYKRIENKTEEIKLHEKLNTISKPMEYENLLNNSQIDKRIVEKGDEKIFEKNVGNDFIQKTKEESIKLIDLLNTRSNLSDHRNLTLSQKLHDVVIPKVDSESRAEILELFSSGSSAERLERLLASRNMTIEELIALRQRGSSQVHFAEIFKARELQASTSLPQNFKTNHKILENYKDNIKSQTRGEETTEKIHIIKEEKKNSSNIEDNADLKNSTGNKEKGTEHLAADLLNQFYKNDNLRKNASPIHETNRPVINPSIKSRGGMDLKTDIENSDLTMRLEEFPAGNNIQRDSEGSSYYTSIEAVKLSVQEEEKKKFPNIFREEKSGVTNSVSSEEIGRVEEILSNDLELIKNAYGVNDHEFSEKKALSKVKPSIIASGGILGVTVVVFLSIFIACRIQQKKKFAYKNSFAKAVFHNPVMTVRKLSNTSSINTIMVDVVATSTTKRPQKHDAYDSDEFERKSDIDNDSLDANDSWDTIPDFMK